jgi:opacity protein-like surface antigen
VGADVGLVKRYDEPRSNPSLGYGLGIHADVDLIPALKVGGYYMLSRLSAGSVVGVTISTFGLRATFTAPFPGAFQPFVYAGAGYSWISYSYSGFLECARPDVPCGPPSGSGRFIEVPLGGGIAYAVSPLVRLVLDAAYRPAFGFEGKVFDGGDARPAHGWSLMFGAAYQL